MGTKKEKQIKTKRMPKGACWIAQVTKKAKRIKRPKELRRACLTAPVMKTSKQGRKHKRANTKAKRSRRPKRVCWIAPMTKCKQVKGMRRSTLTIQLRTKAKRKARQRQKRTRRSLRPRGLDGPRRRSLLKNPSWMPLKTTLIYLMRTKAKRT